MKVAITYTIFTEDYFFIEWYSSYYTVKIGEKLKYKLLKRTVGKHEDSTRPHYHICCIYELQEGAKEYKTLNEKILRTVDDIEFHKDYPNIEKKISFIYEGQQKTFKKKIKLYNESYLQYPFKEYKNDTDIDRKLQYGFKDEELDTMRKCANIEWLDVKRKREQQNILAIEKKQEQEKETDYVLNSLETLPEGLSYDILIRKTIKYILEYCKLNNINVRTSSLKDKAINYLFHAGYITGDEIIEKLYI